MNLNKKDLKVLHEYAGDSIVYKGRLFQWKEYGSGACYTEVSSHDMVIKKDIRMPMVTEAERDLIGWMAMKAAGLNGYTYTDIKICATDDWCIEMCPYYETLLNNMCSRNEGYSWHEEEVTWSNGCKKNYICLVIKDCMEITNNHALLPPVSERIAKWVQSWIPVLHYDTPTGKLPDGFWKRTWKKLCNLFS